MDADPTQRGVFAKRRLLGDFHSPVPATPAAARVKRNAADSIRRATSVAFLPSVRLYETRGQGFRPRLSPDKNPFDGGSLTVVARKANSRFFTNCYHQAAAIAPAHARRPRTRSPLPLPWAARSNPRHPLPWASCRGTGELVFEFKYVNESVPAPGSPGGFRAGLPEGTRSVGLPTQERRDVELILLDGLLHG